MCVGVSVFSLKLISELKLNERKCSAVICDVAPSVSRPGVSAFLMQRRRVVLIVRSIGMRNKKLEKTEV